MKIKLVVMLLLFAMMIPAAGAQMDEKPTVAVLSFGSYPPNTTLAGLGATLFGYDYVSVQEYFDLVATREIDNDKVHIIFGDGNFDFADTNLVVEQALERGADTLVIIGAPAVLSALAATQDMDDPPTLIVNSYSLFYAGIASAPCVKPDNLTGTESVTPYEEIIPLLLDQNADTQSIGVIYNPAEPVGAFSADRIRAAAEDLGIEVRAVGVATFADLPLAARSLLDGGVDALMLSNDTLVRGGLPGIMQIALDYPVPVFHPAFFSTLLGSTVGAGFAHEFYQGEVLGTFLAKHLDGDLDVANTGIYQVPSLYVSVNLDTAAAQGIEISQELLGRADAIVEDGAMGLADPDKLPIELYPRPHFPEFLYRQLIVRVDGSEGLSVADQARWMQTLVSDERKAYDTELLARFACE